jgi:hypothetical protein
VASSDRRNAQLAAIRFLPDKMMNRRGRRRKRQRVPHHQRQTISVDLDAMLTAIRLRRTSADD